MLPAATALALLVAAAPADPGPAGVTWAWQAPAGCPDEATTRRELAAATRTACSLAADAVAVRDAAGWRLELRVRLRDRSDVRTLTASTCRALADAAIVIVAVACTEDALRDGPVAVPVDPPEEPPPVIPAPPGTPGTPAEALPPAPRTDPASLPAGDPPDDPPSVAPPPPRLDLQPAPPVSPSQRRGSRPLGELGLRGGVAWAPTLAPAGLLGLAFRLRWRWIELALDGAYTSARTARYPQMPTLGVATRLAHAGLAVCPALEWGRGLARGRGALCAVFAAGAMFGTGVGAPSNVTRARPWVATGVAPALAWLPHPRISLTLAVDLLFSVVRPAFNLEDLEPLVRAAPFGVRMHTTIYLRLF